MGETRDISGDVLAAIRRIIRGIELHSRQLAQRHGLTGPQLVILQQIVRHRGVTVGRLADQVSLSPGTVTDILDRLQARGLVVRDRDPGDRRRVLVTVTPSARRILRTGPGLMQEHFTRRLSELDDWEQTLLLSSLQRVAAMMGGDALHPPAEGAPPAADGSAARF